MPDSHVWEDGEVELSVSARGVKYKGKRVQFAFSTEDGTKEIGTANVQIEDHLLGNVANGKFRPLKTVAEVDRDALAYRMKYVIKVDGAEKKGFTSRITVHARKVTVKAVNALDGSHFVGARCKLTQRPRPDAPGVVHVAVLETDDQGLVEFPLPLASDDVTVEFEAPYRAEWVRDKGTAREAKITFRPKVKLVYPPSNGDVRQYVNLDADPNRDDDAIDEGQKHRDHGRTLRVLVEAEDVGQCGEGQPVFLKAKFGANNSDRTGAVKAKGQVHEVQGTLMGPKRRAFFDLDLGLAGGDVVDLEVGVKANEKDDGAKVTTWRRLFYELLAAECIASRMPEGTHIDGTTGFDVPGATRSKATSVLEAVFVDYVLAKSQRFADALIPEHETVMASYWGETPERKLVVYAGVGQPSGDVLPFGTDQLARTVHIRLADKTLSPNSNARKNVVGHTQEFAAAAVVNGQHVVVMDLAALRGKLFPKFPGTGTPGVTSATWKAVLTGVAPTQAHPGKEASGSPKSGAVTVKYLTITSVAFELPAEAVTLIGAAGTVDKCPIAISCDLLLSTVEWNGAAAAGRQALKLSDQGGACNGITMCHELGHLMGMTIAPGGSVSPAGMPTPKHVDNGGNFYRSGTPTGGGVRSSGAGAHCADGLSSTDKAQPSFTGKPGTCTMFESGNAVDPPRRGGFCPTCVTYIKARNLTNIRANWSTVAPTDA